MACKRLYRKAVLFGDSITQVSFEEGGWGASAADLLQRKCDVVNRGLSGYNSRWGRILLPHILPLDLLKDTVIATVFFGANDASLPEIAPDKYVSVEDYSANLKEIVEHLKTGGLRPDQIILISPPALNGEEWRKVCIEKDVKMNRKNENTGRYSRACVQVAKDLETHSVDLWSIMQEDKDWKRYLCDGLHLSPAGSQLLWKHLEKHFTKLAESLEMIYPDWSSIDPDNPEASLL
ncbi:putative isoamyl acetate-hydrolyzing esterase 1-like [Apostichopus japonicus]|uniref:Isoamyl acetate-hydrolyzing esterase 1 homolog n=1 Tax=Stichopus japonicus TaxID=307972 RepID=A0A2G8JSG3_STIJA|nr:putative isoamyl acetate-hydrolyzing esterase 1-like [Apostichopus japonicus]